MMLSFIFLLVYSDPIEVYNINFVEHYIKFIGQVYKQSGVIHTTVTQ